MCVDVDNIDIEHLGVNVIHVRSMNSLLFYWQNAPSDTWILPHTALMPSLQNILQQYFGKWNLTGFIFCVWVCMFFTCFWAFPGYSRFLLQFEDIHIRLTVKLVEGVCARFTRCLFLCGPTIDQRLVQGVTPPSHCDSWDQLQHPLQPLIGG